MNATLALLAGLVAAGMAFRAGAAPGDYFAIEVVDEQTGRGVPLVELKTTAQQRFYTDSNGLVAFNEPGLMGQKVYFHVASPGYEYPKDGFGYRGVALEVKAGGSAKVKVKRTMLAERLYRATGQGIYRDTVLLGRQAPIAEPVLNGQVMGQDSVLACRFKGKIYWFWGDTGKPSYPLGLFAMSGATSVLPENGGLKPGVGIDYTYFKDKSGFSRAMAPLPEPGAVWVAGLMVLKDEKGEERMLGQASRVKDLGTCLERCLMAYNNEKEVFERLSPMALDEKVAPNGHPFEVKSGKDEYFYFPVPYPMVRVRKDWKSASDLKTYEAYTPLAAGTKYEKEKTHIERDSGGRVTWSWKKKTPPLEVAQQEELVKLGLMKRDESPFRLADVEDGKAVLLHGASVHWNAYRKKWIMVALQSYGSSFLGEVYYAESDKPEGPWARARKIVTHNKMDFYNPTQLPFFDEEGGRVIYFMGTYTNMFSGDPTPTPLYDYNQMMYRLDLGDKRLDAARGQ